MLILVAVAHLQIKHTSIRIAIFGWKCTGEEIGSIERIVVQHTYGATSCTLGTKVRWIKNIGTLQPPEQARGAISPYYNIVPAVVGSAHTCKIACHACGVVSAASISACFFNRKRARR